MLYPSERYAELAAAPPQRKAAPLGLVNVGNSCYANSLLQSLLATPALAAYLVSGEKHINNNINQLTAIVCRCRTCRCLRCCLPLRALLHLVPVRATAHRAPCTATAAGEHGRGCLKPSASEWCALCELEKLGQQAYERGSGCLSPKPLVRAGWVKSGWTGGACASCLQCVQTVLLCCRRCLLAWVAVSPKPCRPWPNPSHPRPTRRSSRT